MSDYAKATSAPRTATLAGRDYKVFKLRPRDVGEFEAWFRDATPNPKKEALEYMAGQPEAVAMHIWDKACEDAKDWPPSYGSERAQALILTPEGQARILWVCLRRGFADGQFTLDDARDLSEAIGDEGVFHVLSLAQPGDPDDPLGGSAAGAGATAAG